MKTSLVLAFTAISLVGAAAIAAAQTPAVVNSLELQRLVASDAPADHVRLSRHFAALAARYDEDAVRYAAFAPGLPGNPNRPLFDGSRGKWARQAKQARARAEITFSLAVHHARLADGVASIAPEGSGRFHGGYGAPEPTPGDVRAFAATARTRADHTVLVEFYLTEAARADRTVEKHTAMAIGLRATARRAADPAAHCDVVIHEARERGERARNRAFTFRQLADIAG